MAEFFVLRQHYGDKMYLPGDVREASASDVAHLVKSGVLAEVASKAEQPPSNKAERAPKNKAAK